MIEPKALYEAHRAAVRAFSPEDARTALQVPEWNNLSWPEKDYWQCEADVLNEAERGIVYESQS